MTSPSGMDSDAPSALTKRELAAWGLYLVAFGLSVGHQIWLLQTHLTVLVDYSYEPWKYGYLHAIPTYVPAAIFPLALGIACCCRPHGSSLWAPVGAAILAAGTVNTLTYPVQVIIYMCYDILLFLRAVPTKVICLCWPEASLVFLNSTRGQICDCYVPSEGQVRFAMSEGANITNQALAQIGYSTTLDINVTYVQRNGVAWPGDTINTWETSSFKTLILLLQSCIIVTMCRLPMYLLLQHIMFNDRKNKANRDIQQKALNIRERPGSGRHVFQRLAALRVEQVKLASHIWQERNVTLHLVIELCYFNFVEGLDAFTLIDEVVNYSDYFKEWSALTVTLLTFVSITVYLVTTSNALAMLPDGLNRCTKYTKLCVVILGNLPFLVIRITINYLTEGLNIRRLSNIFLMFVAKEVLTLLMGIVEFFMSLYADDSPDDSKVQDASPDKGSILQLFFNRRQETVNNNVADERQGANANAAFEMDQQEHPVQKQEVERQVYPPKEENSEKM